MTGVIATALAFATIATLIFIGVRMKMPPPDPDWREHLPQAPPPPPRWWFVLWFGRWPMLVAVVLASAFEAEALAMAFLALYLAMTVVPLGWRFKTAMRRRRAAARTPSDG
jgi:hypothetical protein